MFYFSIIQRKLIASLLLLLLVACSGLTTKAPELNKEKSSINEKTEQVNAVKLIIDPMKLALPSDLITGYDNVSFQLKKKKTTKAIAKLQQLQVQFPKQSGPSYRLARIYFNAKNYEKTLKAIDACLKINTKNYYAFNLKGMVFREQGEFNRAKIAYLESIKIYPEHLNTHINLGILADIYLYDLPLALKHYQKYLDLNNQKDKKIEGWVIDLKRRLPKK